MRKNIYIKNRQKDSQKGNKTPKKYLKGTPVKNYFVIISFFLNLFTGKIRA